MSDYWNAMSVRSDDIFSPDDFEMAAYRLMSEQVLYHHDKGSRTPYNIVERFEREFEKVLNPFGVQLKVNRTLRYIVAIPSHAKTTSASKAETLFALVLRSIYEESARVDHMSDEGEVLCDLVVFGEKYRLMTGQELPLKGAFDALMRTARRWGIARYVSESEMGVYGTNIDGIAIRPAIVDVLGESALRRLAIWQEAMSTSDDVVEAVQDSEEANHEEA